MKMTRLKLSKKSLFNLLCYWETDEVAARKIAVFLEEFGPSNSPVVKEFFSWVKDELHGLMIYELLPDNQAEELYNSVYYIEFANEIDATAFILRFS
jgi:hypothetical protein